MVSGMREFMFSSERRTTRRRKLHLDLRFHRQNALIKDDNGATSINVSTSGVYFISSVPLLVKENIEVSMTMPRMITGEKPSKRIFTSRVKHVNPQDTPAGYSRVGVQFLYYVRESQREKSCDVALEVRHDKKYGGTLAKQWDASRDTEKAADSP
jgi:hypothetical protein